jgi:hypothetical protein
MRQILILLFILISYVTWGQKHLIGVQGGLNFTNFTSKEGFANTTTKTGFIGGITYDLMLTEKYVLEIDVLYSQRGVNDQFSIIDDYGQYAGQVETEMNYDYLSFPIKIGYKLGNKLKIIPKIGIVPAIAIKAEITSPFIDRGGEIIGKETIDHMDFISKFDFGGIVELGFEKDLSENFVFNSNLNYKHSLTTFSNSDYFDGQDMRHYGFSVTVGIKYRLNK